MSAIENLRTYNQRIIELKENLAKTDYLAIKYAEGELTASEYTTMKEQRRAWRNEINELEPKVKELLGAS